jgi:hypothetical protein
MGTSRVKARYRIHYIAHILILDTLLATMEGQCHTCKDQKPILPDQLPVFSKLESKMPQMLYTSYRVECGLLGCLHGVFEMGIEVNMSSKR